MKRLLSFMLVLTLLYLISACNSEKALPELSSLETMTDSQIEKLLIGQNQSTLRQSWGEPYDVAFSSGGDIYHLNPEHVQGSSHKVIIVEYDKNNIVTSVKVDYCN